MHSSLIFVQLPYSIGAPSDPQSFSSLFHGNTPRILNLSQSTKREIPDLNSFRPYLQELGKFFGSQVNAEWSNPFNQNERIRSRAVESEIAATIWNFNAAIQKKILLIDSTDSENLRLIKHYLSEMSACSKDFKDTVSKIQHPFFSFNLANFMQAYNSYICRFWQFASVMLQNPNLTPGAIMSCIEEIKVCRNALSRLPLNIQNYMNPILSFLSDYLNAFVRYQLGKNEKMKSSYGLAIAYFNSGIQFLQSHQNSVFQVQHLIPANKLLFSALKNELTVTTNENNNIYYVFVPKEIPQLPAPITPSEIPMSISVFQSGQGCSPNNAQSQYISPPSIMGSPMPHTAISYPTIAPLPSIPSSKVAINKDEWDQVCQLKSSLSSKIQFAFQNNNPQFHQAIAQLSQMMVQADQQDQILSFAIGMATNNPQISIPVINALIFQADVFYNSVEERLNIINRTGK